MARQLQQLATVQAAFAARIQQKVADRREEVQDRAEDVPLVGWLLKPIAGFFFDLNEGSNTRKGERGEESVLESLLRGLPATWLIFHNVVVEPQPDDFAQIDLLAISYAGVFLIETKAWQGSFKAYHDNWQIQVGRQWNKVDSPTTQVQRQMRKLIQWLDQHRLPNPRPADGWIMPTVVFTQAQWLSVKQCSVNVFDGQRALVAFLKSQPEGVLTAPQINQLCDLIVRSPAPGS